MRLGGEKLQIGPAASINLLLILINRGLLFYRHTINWAHGRRDYATTLPEPRPTLETTGYTTAWPASHLRVCKAYFNGVTEQRERTGREAQEQLAAILMEELKRISHHE